MKIPSIRFLSFLLCSSGFLAAQTADDTKLTQVIIFGRHSVRAPVMDNSTLNQFAVKPYPAFGVGAGILTANGAKLETILGAYYRQWLTQEGLLTGNDQADASSVYFRANVLERTIVTAQALAAGMLPQASINVNHYGPTESDPLFDPIGAGVAQLDMRKAIAAVEGRLGGNAQSLTSAYAAELALARSLLLGYPAGQTPAPAAPAGVIDVTAIPFGVTAGTPQMPVNLGGLMSVNAAVDPFIMEYGDGMPGPAVGWGQMTPGSIIQTLRLYNLPLDLECRTPYLAGLEGSNLATHVTRSMVQAATGSAMAGSLGNPSTKIIVLIASDSNLGALGGLLRLDWLLPGYPPNYASPGAAVVFQIRQSQSTGERIVRASYIGQTMDQLRNQTALSLATPPARAPLFIPGCSVHNATFDCPLAKFVRVVNLAIDPESADLVN